MSNTPDSQVKNELQKSEPLDIETVESKDLHKAADIIDKNQSNALIENNDASAQIDSKIPSSINNHNYLDTDSEDSIPKKKSKPPKKHKSSDSSEEFKSKPKQDKKKPIKIKKYKHEDSDDSIPAKKPLEKEEIDEDYYPSSQNSDETPVSLLSEEEGHGDMEGFDLEEYLKFRQQCDRDDKIT